MENMKIMKNIFKIHPLTYLLIIISLLSGRFKTISLYLLLIIIHELGHLLIGVFFNWKIDKIYIYPLGGLTKFKEKINKPFIEELLVNIMGPLFQIIFTLIIKRYDKNILLFSNSLLAFNLLPIIPLDGGKLLNIFLFLFKPIKKSIKYIIILSHVTYFVLLFYIIRINSLFFLIIFISLIFKIIEESKKNMFYFNKYLLEKYLYVFKYKKNIIIDDINQIYKYKNNFIKINNKLYNEKEYVTIKNNCNESRKMVYYH